MNKKTIHTRSENLNRDFLCARVAKKSFWPPSEKEDQKKAHMLKKAVKKGAFKLGRGILEKIGVPDLTSLNEMPAAEVLQLVKGAGGRHASSSATRRKD